MKVSDRVRVNIPGDPDHNKLGSLLFPDLVGEYDWYVQLDDRSYFAVRAGNDVAQLCRNHPMDPLGAPMNHYEALKDARRLIANKDRWTTGAGARKADGSGTFPTDGSATCWCAIGALGTTVLEGHVWAQAFNTLNDASHVLYAQGAVEVNDELGHAAVMRAYDRAIDIALTEVTR